MPLRDGPYKRGDAMPHITVEKFDGGEFNYQTVWQQRNLVLVVVGDAAPDRAYAEQVTAAAADFSAREAVAVATRTPVEGLSTPGALVVDRWGRVIHAAQVQNLNEMPPVSDLLSWVDYTQMRCG